MVREKRNLIHPRELGKAAVRANAIKEIAKKGWQFQLACV
jgi:hypothetical protein